MTDCIAFKLSGFTYRPEKRNVIDLFLMLVMFIHLSPAACHPEPPGPQQPKFLFPVDSTSSDRIAACKTVLSQTSWELWDNTLLHWQSEMQGLNKIVREETYTLREAGSGSTRLRHPQTGVIVI